MEGLIVVITVSVVTSALLTLAALVVAILTFGKARDHGTLLKVMHAQFNSRMDQLLAAKRAEGVLEGEGGRGPAVVGPAPERPTGL